MARLCYRPRVLGGESNWWRRLLAILFIFSVGIGLLGCSRNEKKSSGIIKPGQSASVEVFNGKDASLESADGLLRITIPGTALSGDGKLTVTGAKNEDGQLGWTVDLSGGASLTGEATMRFARPKTDPGEPDPLVLSAPTPKDDASLAPNQSADEKEIVVTTDHFSFWFVPDWKKMLSTATNWVGDKIDAAFSMATVEKKPRCADESVVQDMGYQVSSSKGRRVYWCLGADGDTVVLKVVNGRGYGVSAESTPGLAVKEAKRSDLLGMLGELLKSPPSKPGNSVNLMASGDQITYSLSGTAKTGLMVKPDAGAYLLSALQYSVETVTMFFDKVQASTPMKKMLTALEGEQCMQSLTSMATTDLDTSADASKFFGDALEMAFSCVADSVDDIEMGPINKLWVQPIMWLMQGISTAANGIVAVIDSFDVNGYQVIITPPAVPATKRIVIDPFTSGGLSSGWTLDRSNDNRQPIDCTYDDGSSNAVGPNTHSCGTTADSASACWAGRTNSNELWCLDTFDPNSRQLWVAPAVNVTPTPTPKTPQPLFLELSDGSRWTYRISGATDMPPDGYYIAYYCLNEVGVCNGTNSRGYYRSILGPEKGGTVDTSKPAWRVRVSEVGVTNGAFQPMTWMNVRTAWFMAGRH